MQKVSRRLRRLLPILLLALAPASCSSDKTAADAGAPAMTVLAPVPAPPGLLADLCIGAPEATWQKARALIGGSATFLPQTLGVLATTVLGLPITVASEFDGNVPAIAAIVDAPGDARPLFAVGLHVQVGDRLIATLTKGESALFTPRVDSASLITYLQPKSAPNGLAIGVLGNYLLVAADAAQIAGIGPYVARTLGPRAASKDDLAADISGEALSGPIRARVQKMAAELLPALDLAAPSAAIGPLLSVQSSLDKLLSILGDLESARITANLDPGVVRVRATAGAKPGQGPSSQLIADLAGGDARPILDLPAGTLLALVSRETASARRTRASESVDAFAKALGTGDGGADRDAIAKAMAGLAAGRGDWFTAGFRFGGTGSAAYLRGAVADAGVLERAIDDFVLLAKLAPAKERLRDMDLRISSKKTTIEKVGDAERIRFESGATTRARAAKSGAKEVPEAIDLLYAIGKDVFIAAAGVDAKSAFQTIANAPDGKLEADPTLRAAIEGLGSDANFVLASQPIAIVASLTGKANAAASAPFVIAGGRTLPSAEHPGSLWLRLEIANADVLEFGHLSDRF